MLMLRLTPALLLAALAAQDDAPVSRKLATIPKELELSTTYPAPDGSRVESGARFAFGADGAFVAYIAWRRGRSVAMVGEQELGDFDYLHPPALDVTARHYAFRAGNRIEPTKERWWAIVDGKRSKAFAWIGEVAVSAVGEAAFWEQPGAKIERSGAYNRSSMLLHVGRRKGKKFEGALSLVMPSFSDDGKTVATAALRGREWFPLLATTRKEKVVGRRGHQFIEDVVISADGKRTALVVNTGGMPLPPGVPPPPGVEAGKLQILVDGTAFGAVTDGAGAPVFAPTGKRLAFKFVQGDKMGVAFDNDKAPEAEHDFVATPVFDRKGTTIAYASNRGGRVEPYARLQRWGAEAVKGGTWSLFTRKGKAAAKAVVEDCEGIARPTFGPKGELAYAQGAKGRWYVLVGDRRSEGYDHVGRLHWSQDGKTVAFGARRDRELWWVVLPVE